MAESTCGALLVWSALWCQRARLSSTPDSSASAGRACLNPCSSACKTATATAIGKRHPGGRSPAEASWKGFNLVDRQQDLKPTVE